MNKVRQFVNIILILFFFIVLHNAIVTLLANVFTLMRVDNKEDVILNNYEERIETLEKTIFEYESSLEKLKIYEGASYVLSKIAMRDIYDFYDFLIINTNSKVEEGSAVVDEFGLVGLIESSNKTTAKVSLLTGNVKVSVKIGEIYGMLDEYDKKDNVFIVHNINNYQRIEKGTEVVTSGLQKIDEGLKIGTVEKTETIGVEQKVYVKPNTDYSSLNYLMVISK